MEQIEKRIFLFPGIFEEIVINQTIRLIRKELKIYEKK